MKLTSWVLGKVLPDKVKRMIFMSSLAAYLRDIDQPEDEVLQKLNSVLRLSSDYRAMRFPIVFHSYIWASFDTCTITDKGIACESHTLKGFRLVGLTKPQARIVADKIIAYIPDWLRYASKNQTRKDVYRLFVTLELFMPQMQSK